MAYVRDETTGFTVTFRSLVLRAFTREARPVLAVPRLLPTSLKPGVANGPLAERIRAAFTDLPPNETEIRVIGALLRFPGATSDVLSKHCGWVQPIWQTHFGLMCQRRVGYLWPTQLADEPDAKFLTGVLAEYRPNRGIFTFKPEVAKALRALEIDWEG